MQLQSGKNPIHVGWPSNVTQLYIRMKVLVKVLFNKVKLVLSFRCRLPLGCLSIYDGKSVAIWPPLCISKNNILYTGATCEKACNC